MKYMLTVQEVLKSLTGFTRIELYDADGSLAYVGTAAVAFSECAEYADCYCEASTKFFKSRWTSQILIVCYIHIIM